MSAMRHLLLAAALILCALAVVSGARGQSGDHGDGHAQHHDWYRTLHTRTGSSCCNGDATTANGTQPGDCRPVRARFVNERWQAFYDGEWNVIPDAAILPDELNLVPLHAHICERAGFVYCFLRGGNGG